MRKKFLGLTQKGRNKHIFTIERKKMLSQDTMFSALEAYRAARTNLMYLPIADHCRRIVLTSAICGEGKTLNSINLAIVMAQSGQRVLLIDADMRKPRIAQMFDVHPEGGLSEFLAGMDQTPKIIPSGRDNLWIMSSGKIPPNPAELLASPRMDELFEAINEKFDYVLLDTPPLNVVTDASVLTGHVHGFLIVVKAEYSDIHSIQESVMILEQLGATIYGFILGDVDLKVRGYGKRYSTYEKYHKSSRDEKYSYK